jgi:hypothetical protein
MSMPSININPDITLETAITNIIASIALEEAGLSHILNAEGEKIQAALKLNYTIDDLVAINNSVQGLAASVAEIEDSLQGKLSDSLDAYATLAEAADEEAQGPVE